MQKNNIQALFNATVGHTVQLKRECSEFTGLTIKTIQDCYANPNKGVSMVTALKFQRFFSYKMGRNVGLDEIVCDPNIVQTKVAKEILDNL